MNAKTITERTTTLPDGTVIVEKISAPVVKVPGLLAIIFITMVGSPLLGLLAAAYQASNARQAGYSESRYWLAWFTASVSLVLLFAIYLFTNGGVG